MKHFKDDPRFLSGWNHAYFCENDGARLVLDMERPDHHECQVCGKIYTGFTYDCAHISILRAETGITAIKSAMIYACSHNPEYLEHVMSIVEFYAKTYERFPKSVKLLVLDDAPRTGRIMTQAPDEALFIIRLLCAMEIVKPDLDEKWIAAVKKNLFAKMRDMLKALCISISYDSCWIDSAIGVMGLFFNEPDWVREAVCEEFGLYEQIEKGVTPDGFWHVGSISYNFSVLEGMTYFFAFADVYGYEVSEFSQQIVIYMYDACYKYAFDNGELPCSGDGWPGISLKTYMHCFCLACKAFGKTMKKYLRHVESLNILRTQLPINEPFYYDNSIPLEKLLFAPRDDEAASERTKLGKRASKSYDRAYKAMMRNDVFNVYFTYGHEFTRNAHYDMMNIEIMAGMRMLTCDQSSTGYMTKLLNDWYKSGMAHNTCVVDGTRANIKEPGRLLLFNDTKIVAECDPYEGVLFRRSIELKNNVLMDDFIVECYDVNEYEDMEQDEQESIHVPVERRIEWFFHFEELIAREYIDCVPTAALRGPFYFNPQEIRTDDTQILSLLLSGGIMVYIRMYDNMRAFICRTPSNPANRDLDTIVLRTIGHKARFRTEIIYPKE